MKRKHEQTELCMNKDHKNIILIKRENRKVY